MTRKVHCEKKTKIYIPKTVNPQIISYRIPEESVGTVQVQNNSGNNLKGIKQQ